MHDQRTYSIPHEQRRRVEAAILALVLAEDWPWRVGEIAQRLRLPADVIGLGTATLRADGLVVYARTATGGSGQKLRASWAAVRGDELANSIKRPALRAAASDHAIAIQ
jgi:predicted ArsR family transcriptional regulator